MTVSTALRFIATLPRPDRRSFRNPWLVIAGGGRPLATAQHRARRPVSGRRAGQVRHMLLLPRVFELVRILRRLIGRVMEPAVPLRRHARGFDFAGIDHPAPFAARPAAAADELARPTQPVIAIAGLVSPDQLAVEPG